MNSDHLEMDDFGGPAKEDYYNPARPVQST